MELHGHSSADSDGDANTIAVYHAVSKPDTFSDINAVSFGDAIPIRDHAAECDTAQPDRDCGDSDTMSRRSVRSRL
jgi:hypothetical protein